MPRGGARVGAGRPRKGPTPAPKAGAKQANGRLTTPVPRSKSAQPPADVQPTPKTPLEYMLAVMNDPEADKGRKDRLAVAAAPYMHPKMGEGGKKDAKATAAKAASSGRFAPAAPPLKLVAKR